MRCLDWLLMRLPLIGMTRCQRCGRLEHNGYMSNSEEACMSCRHLAIMAIYDEIDKIDGPTSQP